MKTKAPYLITGLIFILFNAIAFLVPSEKNASFWIAYAFTIISFAVEAFVWWKAIGKKQELKSKLLGVSVTYISIVYLILQIVAFLIIMFVPNIPTWLCILICALLLVMSLVFMISANIGTEIITATDNKVAAKRQYIKDLQIDVEMLAETETNSEIKQRLIELSKKIRFSDPMSDPSLSDVEKDLSDKISAIGSSSNKADTIQEAEMLLLKRDKKVKALKG